MVLCLTLDTSIICMSHNQNNNTINIKKLLECIFQKKHNLVVDRYQNKILKEYKICVEGYTKEWLAQMILKNRLYKVDIRKKYLPKDIIKDKYDKKFLLVCLQSSDKLLISKDPHFCKSKCLEYLIKNKGRFLDIIQAIDFMQC